MNILFALGLALVSSIWLVVMTRTGWYHDPDRMELSVVVPIVEILLVVIAAWSSRRRGATIWRSVGSCLLITLLGASLSAGFGFVYTRAVPDYFTHLREVHAAGLRQAGRNDKEIAAALASHAIGTPSGFALNRLRNMLVYGCVGTVAGAILLFVARPERK